MSNRTERGNREGRSLELTPGFLKHPEGSALIRCGDTMVVCAVSIETRVKEWLRGTGRGWVTAEYAMLPRANANRGLREGQFGRWPSGRSQEIQRFIGRCLRGAVWQGRLGERTITVDCDVLQADGGTRTASVTGGFVALAIALDRLVRSGAVSRPPLKGMLAAASVGISGGKVLLDLDYGEDSSADVDLNVAADDRGRVVEVQATAEGRSFAPDQLDAMVRLGLEGVARSIEAQSEALSRAGVDVASLVERPEESP